MLTSALVGYLGGVLTTLALFPEIHRIIKVKRTDQLSYLWLLTIFTGLVLWAAYGFLINSGPLIIMNLVQAVLYALLIALKLRYSH